MKNKRIEALEYEVACLKYDLETLRESVAGPRKQPPPIRFNPRLARERPHGKREDECA